MNATTLSPTQAGALAARVRKLRQQLLLTAHQAALMDVMLWCARKPGSSLLTASLATLARLAGQCRRTTAEGIRRLEELGLIQRIRRRVRVAWGGGVASRQIANAYRLLVPDTECKRPPAREEHLIISLAEGPSGAQRIAQQALEKLRAARTRALFGRAVPG